MPYPESPFVKLDEELQMQFNNLPNQFREPDLLKKLCKWICTAPRITTLRFNKERVDYGEFKKILAKHFSGDPGPTSIPKFYQHPLLEDVIVIESFHSNIEIIDREHEPAAVVVDTLVGAAVLRGAHIFAPGIKGLTSGSRIDQLVHVYVDVENMCNRGFAKQFENDAKVFIGRGILRQPRHQLFSNNAPARGIGVEMIENIAKCPIIEDQKFKIHGGLLQNLPSILCGHILNPKPQDRVLDMCAAPGNKTTHLSALMHNQGTLIALEKVKSKIEPLKEKLKTFQVDNVSVFQCDSTKILTEEPNCIDVPPFSRNTFDKILLDAPCSGLGQRPQFYNKMSVKELRSYVPLQRKLFTNAVELLKPGGYLLYSTCTITLTENELMVSWALKTFASILELISAEPRLGGPGWLVDGLNDEQCEKLQRFSHLDQTKDDSVGFFIAFFRKKGLETMRC